MKTEEPENYCLFGRARVDRNWASWLVGMFPTAFALSITGPITTRMSTGT